MPIKKFKKISLLFLTTIPITSSIFLATSFKSASRQKTISKIMSNKSRIEQILSRKINSDWNEEDLFVEMIKAGFLENQIEKIEKISSKNNKTNSNLFSTSNWKITLNSKNGDNKNEIINLIHSWNNSNSLPVNLSNIREDVYAILLTKVYSAWSQEELQLAIDKKYEANNIKVEKVISNNSYSSNFGWKKDTWNFLAISNKFESEMSIEHEWLEEIKTLIDINKIKNNLQKILNTKENSNWTEQDLEETIVIEGIDLAKGITVKKESNKNVNGENITTWIFTGNGTVNNNFKYNKFTRLEHHWKEKVFEVNNIYKIKNQLEQILNKRVNSVWTQAELQLAIDEAKFDEKGAIIVELQEKISNRSWSMGWKKSFWSFKSIDSEKSKFEGIITLEHEYLSSTNQFKNISIIENDLQKLLNSRTKINWTKADLEREIVRNNLDIKGGITVEKLDYIESRSWVGDDKTDSWKIIGNGNLNNSFSYNESIILIHKWNNKYENTKKITSIKTYLQNVLDSKTNRAWTKATLEQAIVNANIDVSGGVIVEEIANNSRSWSGGLGQTKWNFTGKGSLNSPYKYKGTISLTHKWNDKKDTSINIETINNEISNLLKLNELIEKEWDLVLLQSKIDEKYGVGEITVSLDKTNQKQVGEIIKVSNTYLFKGNGKIDNVYKYNQSTTLIHNWEKPAKSLISIKTIETQLKNILNEKQDSNWDINELQMAIDALKLDFAKGITVEVIKNNKNTRSSETINVERQYKFVGNGTLLNEFKYNESITLLHKWNYKKDNSQHISKIEKDLQKILDSRKSSDWTKSELEAEIVKQKVDVERAIVVENIKSRIRSSQTLNYKSNWNFIGKGDQTNNYKYNENIILVHSWFKKEDTTSSISNIQSQLQKILDEKKTSEWNVGDLQNRVDKDYGSGEITVGSTRNITPYSSSIKNNQSRFTFIGNGSSLNDFQYNSSISLTQKWTTKVDTTKNINDYWSQIESAIRSIKFKVNTSTAEVINTVLSSLGEDSSGLKIKISMNIVGGNTTHIYIELIGLGNINNNYKFYNTTGTKSLYILH
ncbi:hypothetical protein ESOMN_v1c02840 [Williamsoniiplasma somnilux]|uniref:P35 lipoprotein family protein n=1 Tax=Williamsoniiplasma somnilux TaxID=215578 RepID=A0A2K8NYN4_9MOLU|nr:hypothetical protein [Williamsoniiplasma somnilux]ATZ18666.1 hypothetical protein ESOMN_v1c02840 [Williamsoniiplasma somnilux]